MRFPETDIECRLVVPFQAGDAENAYPYIKKFDCVIQAGGNVGVWPIKLIEDFKEVYTFEPDAENYDCLIENIGDLNINHRRAALGEVAGTGSLEGRKTNCGAYQTIDGDDFDIITIDSLKLKPDFICLDIEGFEIFALKGAVKTIEKYKPVIMIEDKGLSERYGYNKGDCGEFLKGFGYREVCSVNRDVIFCAV